jgi:hypothetical protein
MDLQVDLVADLNDQDDNGLGWSTLDDALDARRVRPGVMLVAKTSTVRSSSGQ